VRSEVGCQLLSGTRRIADGEWRPVLELDADHPTGDLSLGEHGAIPLDLVALPSG